MDRTINEMHTLEAAEAYLAEGVSLVLLHGPVKGSDSVYHCSCGHPECASPVKHPIETIHVHGPKSPITSLNELQAAKRELHARGIERPNLAIILPEGWAALDLDAPRGTRTVSGMATLGQLIKDHRSWGWTPFVQAATEKTGSGGRHHLVTDLGTTTPARGILASLDGSSLTSRATDLIQAGAVGLVRELQARVEAERHYAAFPPELVAPLVSILSPEALCHGNQPTATRTPLARPGLAKPRPGQARGSLHGPFRVRPLIYAGSCRLIQLRRAWWSGAEVAGRDRRAGR